MTIRRAVPIAFACLLAASCAAGATWTTVDLTPYANWRLQAQGGLSGVPTGVSNFAGVPFAIAASGNNSWNADLAAGANPRVLDVAVSVRSARRVYLLVNTIWGQTSGSYCTVTISDSAGTDTSLSLVGGQHCRDYNQGSFAATVNGTTTVQGWSDGACGTNAKRLDVLAMSLPASWAGKRVTRVRVLDSGATNVQRAMVSGITLESADADAHLQLDLARVVNWTWKTDPTMTAEPQGVIDLAGVPFTTPATGNDCWNANVAGANPVTMTLPVRRYGVKVAHTLVNTLFGQPGPSSYAKVTFLYAGGGQYEVPLVGNADIRDYNAYIWTNTINGTTTQNVWNNGLCASTLGHRLDMQTIALPAQFLGTRLDSIRFTDTGADNVQRMVLHGVTLDADPVMVTAGVAPGIAAPAPMQAYPNPAGGAFRLRLGARAAAGAVTVELVDVRGRRVGRSLVAPAGATELAIDPAALGVRPAPGLYFARIAGEPRGAARIVVLR